MVSVNNTPQNYYVCGYGNDLKLRSIEVYDASTNGFLTGWDIECDNSFRVIKTTNAGDIRYSYNANGEPNLKTYGDGAYYRYDCVSSDSVAIYFRAAAGGTESYNGFYKQSSTVKNPFRIAGFENEGVATSIILYYVSVISTMTPHIDVKTGGAISFNHLCRASAWLRGCARNYDCHFHFLGIRELAFAAKQLPRPSSRGTTAESPEWSVVKRSGMRTAAQASHKQLNVAFGEGCERSSARPAEDNVCDYLRCYTMRKGLKRKARNGAE